MIDLRQTEVRDWLSLREASEKMGVSSATLRGWADEGRVESYRTPGGHRRFRVSESNTPFRHETKKTDTRWRLLEHSAVGQVQLLREETETPNPALAPHALTEQREMERALIRLCTDGIKGQANVQERARELGEAYGKWNWRYDIGLRGTMDVLRTVRRAFSESVVEFSFGLNEQNVDELNLWLRRANEIIDGVLVSMLEYRSEETAANVAKR